MSLALAAVTTVAFFNHSQLSGDLPARREHLALAAAAREAFQANVSAWQTADTRAETREAAIQILLNYDRFCDHLKAAEAALPSGKFDVHSVYYAGAIAAADGSQVDVVMGTNDSSFSVLAWPHGKPYEVPLSVVLDPEDGRKIVCGQIAVERTAGVVRFALPYTSGDLPHSLTVTFDGTTWSALRDSYDVSCHP
jgi:hypothetical protein